ncbi:MAG: hypothetical protein QOH14_4107, partial [Pseudonocardiales bacterium]|nr:hypothetical protein [Pseudonocardiales bacterium]
MRVREPEVVTIPGGEVTLGLPAFPSTAA